MNKFIELILTLCLIQLVRSHGYMKNPASRNCMWRYGFRTPINYNDNELWCGGAFKMAALGGKCGVCGDTADQPNQPNADGGRFATGTIAKTYRSGQTITVDIKLTTAHWGYFEFRIGEFNNKKVTGDQHGKLQGYLLKQVNGQTRFKVPDNIKSAQYQIQLKLPSALKCSRCVLQWWYKAGNNWGCEKGKCGMGYGTQEHFVNCADVRIQ